MGNEGEGNRTADRNYRRRTRAFVDTHPVEELAREAVPQDEDEARELARAEEAGKARVMETDPELKGRRPPTPKGTKG